MERIALALGNRDMNRRLAVLPLIVQQGFGLPDPRRAADHGDRRAVDRPHQGERAKDVFGGFGADEPGGVGHRIIGLCKFQDF